MPTVTTRETVHALVDGYPDEELDTVAALLSCRRSADGTDFSAKAILARHGERAATGEEFATFEAEYGPFLPPDGEG
jgi:hypothetical protein